MNLALAILAVFCTAIILYFIGRRHQRADWGNRFLNSLDGWNRLFCRYYHGLKFNPPYFNRTGAALVAANHLSGLDPLLLIAANTRPIRFIIAREQFERFGLRWLYKAVGCIPVDRQKNPQTAFREALRMLKEGEVVALFPQGGIRPDTRLKAGVVRLAKLAGCPVYPVHIEGIRPLAVGHTLVSVVIPSRAVLHCYPAVDCRDEQVCLQTLQVQMFQPLATLENHPEYPN